MVNVVGYAHNLTCRHHVTIDLASPQRMSDGGYRDASPIGGQSIAAHGKEVCVRKKRWRYYD